MTLSEVVRACFEQALDVKLRSEVTAGRSNRVDFFSSNEKMRIELERRREDPVNNVVKAWRQACEGRRESFTLFHVFSGFYSARRAKRDNARFVGERMNEWAERNSREIRCKDISFDYEPPQGNADPRLSMAEANRISDQIRRQLEGWRVGWKA